MNWNRFASFCERYYQAHREGADIHEAAAIAEQRKYGRQLGADIHVTWHPGRDAEIDAEARWLLAHGSENGVIVVVE